MQTAQGQRTGEAYMRPSGAAAAQQPPGAPASAARTTPAGTPPMKPSAPVASRPPERGVEPAGPTKDEKVLQQDSAAECGPETVESRKTSEAKSAIQMLKELNELKEAGAITEEEYEMTKKNLLKKI